ncbi:hypothetical protein PPYR_05239 [Photinus pyralis]|uniref:Origin recognition complex subunit 2 n=1 Tax=Photinus pyralis TaxID=7054 RepID=A0A1Y1NMR4_PHOPY|nr:origin recognition complex subunit 2 [Photinus pyralis]KAB0800885.1 hypothetical protein PPYR_05239 [Photinus pyralis]
MSYNIRKRLKNVVVESDEEEKDFEESASDYSPSESESASSSSELENSSSESDNSSHVESSKKLPTKFRQDEDHTYIIKSDDYFSNCTKKKAVTSNNKFTDVDTSRLEQGKLQDLLSSYNVTVKHNKQLKQVAVENRDQFSKWLYILKEGFNVLLYGLGSKIKILNEFREKCLGNLPVLVVDGFFPNLSIKDIVTGIVNDILELSDNPTNVYEACDVIINKMSSRRNLCFYMIVHNIEGEPLKNQQTQTLLSKLAAVPNIHIVASIDHISAPLIWVNTQLSKFNFVWYNVTSFLPYLRETSFEESSIVQQPKALVLSSLNNVFMSLTSKTKDIYLIMVKYQLEHGKAKHYKGFAFKKLYGVCKEGFLVSTDLALRSQLTEFVDHEMVKIKRSNDGVEYLVIPIDNNVLQQFVDKHSKE